MDTRLDLAVIGAQKAGTTSLCAALASHPELWVPPEKELAFFSRDDLFERGPGHLALHYRTAPESARRVLADTHLMYFPEACGRLHAHAPQVSCLAVLRDPVERAHSAYWYAVRQGFEPEQTFEAALERERAELASWTGHVDRSHRSYLDHGLYARQLRPFFERFGRERVRVLLSDELDEPAVWASLLEWLGVSAAPRPERARENAASQPRLRWLHDQLTHEGTWAKRAWARLAPYTLRRRLRTALTGRVERWNLVEEPNPPLAPETRARLEACFAPHNAELAELLGRPLPGWSR